ncbi:hypothetical protein H8356DRAFT_1431484 [Neocallimastix lanati (nom. inval.)]|nr:hypothetical protein H8356DRAFT_1431484 [Neocallimastix sp. JGI-2020a]
MELSLLFYYELGMMNTVLIINTFYIFFRVKQFSVIMNKGMDEIIFKTSVVKELDYTCKNVIKITNLKISSLKIMLSGQELILLK